MNFIRSFFFFLFLSPLVLAKTYLVGPSDNWFGLLHGGGLQPADEVILKAGIYSNIVIRATEGARVVFRRPDARQNTFNLAGTQHLKLQGLEITGGSSGIRIYKKGNRMAKYVTLDGLHIHHVGEVAVTCNNVGNTYEGMIFRRNHIHHTSGHGEAFYLGSNSGPGGKTQAQFFHGVIEGNYIHDLKGP